MSDHHDRQDIEDVLVRYASGLDGRDWSLLATCFTDDCDLDYGPLGSWSGAKEFVDYMEVSNATMGLSVHRITNVAIKLAGETATARCYVDALVMAADGQSGLNPVGFYDDELVSSDGGWRIARRTFTMLRFGAV